MLDRADYADFYCHNSIRLEAEHSLNTLALTVISFSRRFVFAVQKHYLFCASNPLVFWVFLSPDFELWLNVMSICLFTEVKWYWATLLLGWVTTLVHY